MQPDLERVWIQHRPGTVSAPRPKSCWVEPRRTRREKNATVFRSGGSGLTDHDPIGEDEELHVWSEGAEHQASCHHHATENGHRTSPKVVHTGAADGTCREDRRTGDTGRSQREVPGHRCCCSHLDPLLGLKPPPPVVFHFPLLNQSDQLGNTGFQTGPVLEILFLLHLADRCPISCYQDQV